MGKAIVSTPGGINGLDLEDGRELLVANDPDAMAEAIIELIRNPARRREFEKRAREGAERDYNWDAIGRRQDEIYRSLFRVKSAPTSSSPNSP